VEANSTGGQGSGRAVAPSDDDDDDDECIFNEKEKICFFKQYKICLVYT
jgi:hypothetical protein